MNKKLKLILSAILVVITINSCKKKETSPAPKSNTAISQDDLQKIKALGFNPDGVKQEKDGYVVEGDIFISKESLNKTAVSPGVIIAKTEQYRTFNLIQSLPRTISVSINGLTGNFVTATDNAIARWNALKLTVKFQRVGSNGSIVLGSINEGPDADGFITLGRGGFPQNGNPYNSIVLNLYVYSPTSDVGYLTSVIQHELGHCIGLRHTDYFNRAFSCGVVTSTNVEAANYNSSNPQAYPGAFNIPGTPTTEDAGSLMLACNNGIDRTFNANDAIALQYLYPDNSAFANVAASRSVNKNNCAVLNAGTSVVYIVPAGKYTSYSQAAADQKAQDDLIANSQYYANTHGSCTYPNNWKIDQWVLTSMPQSQSSLLNISLSRPQPDASQLCHIYFAVHRAGQPDLSGSFTAPAGSASYSTTVDLHTVISGQYTLGMVYVY